MSKRVYIGVGHGGSDPGAVGNGFMEKNLNLSVAKYCAAALKRCGITTKLSRTVDAEVWLPQRIKEANAFKADLALDIHHNAGGGDGAEVYHTYKYGTGATLAKNILAYMVAIGQNSRGNKIKKNESGYDYFGFIRQTNMPAVLVECCFVDSADIKIEDTAAERKKMGEAIAKGICKTLAVPFVAEATTVPVKTYVKGQTLTLTKANLYASSSAKTATKVISGKYYIYDGRAFNGRYRVTNKKSFCGKTPVGRYVTGYINL